MSRPKDQFHTTVESQFAAVQTEVIIFCHSPSPVGDMLVIARTLFIPRFHMGPSGGGIDPMLCHHPIGPVGQHTGNKDMKAILPSLQDVVCTAPHDNKLTFIRQILIVFGLIGVDLIRHSHILPLVGVIVGVAPR